MLRFMQSNICGEKTTIFVRIGVAKHDLNGLASARGQHGFIQDALEEIWRAVQIFYCFKQWDHWRGSAVIKFESHLFHEQSESE